MIFLTLSFQQATFNVAQAGIYTNKVQYNFIDSRSCKTPREICYNKPVTKVVYYLTSQNKNPVKDFLQSLTKKQKLKVFRIFDSLEKYGLSSIIPHVRKLSGTPLWEIRILGQDNIRIVYIAIKDDNILILHGFIKKSQKTPENEISISLKRYQDWVLTK